MKESCISSSPMGLKNIQGVPFKKSNFMIYFNPNENKQITKLKLDYHDQNLHDCFSVLFV